MPSPTCLVNSLSTVDGINTTPGATVSIELADTTGVTNWSIRCIYTDDEQSASAITSSLTIDSVNKTATFSAPGTVRGSAMIFESKVNNGVDLNGTTQSSYTTRFGVFAIGTSGLRLLAANQTTEGDAEFGWVTDFNQVIELGGTAPNATTSTAGTLVLTNDLGGTYNAPLVVGLQGVDIDNWAPASNEDGYSIVYNFSNDQFQLADIGSAVSPATTGALGTIQLSGDFDASSTATAPVIGAINGASVPASGALTTDHVLKVSGPSALSYGYIVNSNVDASANIAASKLDLTSGTGTISQSNASTTLAATSGSVTLGNTNTGSGTVIINGAVRHSVSSELTSNTALNSSHYLVRVNTGGGSFTVTLPAHSAGRTIVIKDVGGGLSSNPLTVARNGGTGTIEGNSSNDSLTTDYGGWHYISDGVSNWMRI